MLTVAEAAWAPAKARSYEASGVTGEAAWRIPRQQPSQSWRERRAREGHATLPLQLRGLPACSVSMTDSRMIARCMRT